MANWLIVFEKFAVRPILTVNVDVDVLLISIGKAETFALDLLNS